MAGQQLKNVAVEFSFSIFNITVVIFISCFIYLRLYADILNDFSFFVDLLTPLFANTYSIYFISFSGVLRVSSIKS